MEIINYEDWIKKAKELYGEDPDNWKFKCPICGHIQSIKSVLEHGPSLERQKVQDWIHYNCEGRINEGYGCDWTLGGFFHVHKVEVEFNGKLVPVFEYA